MGIILLKRKKTISSFDDKTVYKYFNLNSEFKFNFHSSVARALFQNPNECLQGKSEGSLISEVDVIDLPDETKPGIIFQFSFFDKKTKNKIYEFGLNFYLEELNLKPQAKATSNSKIVGE